MSFMQTLDTLELEIGGGAQELRRNLARCDPGHLAPAGPGGWVRGARRFPLHEAPRATYQIFHQPCDYNAN